MGGLMVLLVLVSIMTGLYLITLGLWELRVAVNRYQFIKYMFSGLFLIVILPPLFWIFIGNIL